MPTRKYNKTGKYSQAAAQPMGKPADKLGRALRGPAFEPGKYHPEKYKLIEEAPPVKGVKAPSNVYLHYPFDIIPIGMPPALIPNFDEHGIADPNANMSRIKTAIRQYLDLPRNKDKAFLVRIAVDPNDANNPDGLGFYIYRTK